MTCGDIMLNVEFYTGAQERVLPVAQIKPNRFQPRKEFNQQAIDELAQSMRENGVIQPIIVRIMPEYPEFFEIIAGERRFRAAKMLGWQEIPAIIRDYSHEQSMQLALVENIQRQDLNAIEEAHAIKLLVDSCMLSHEEVARKIGKSRSAVTNILRLLALPACAQDMLVEGKVTAGQLRPLLAITSQKEQQDLLALIVERSLSARDVERLVKKANSRRISSKKSVIDEPSDVHLKQIEYELVQVLATKVKIQGDAQNGKLEIEYYCLEDLERLLALLNPERDGGKE